MPRLVFSNENAGAGGGRDNGPGELVRPCPQCQNSMFLKTRAVRPRNTNSMPVLSSLQRCVLLLGGAARDA